MHVSLLLSTSLRPGPPRTHVPPVRTILRATGIGVPIPLGVVSLLTVILYRDGRIKGFGPMMFNPPISVILVIPLLLSMGCGVVHATWATPVIHRSARVHLARAMSYTVALSASGGVSTVGCLLAQADVASGIMRNLLWMTGVAVATAALAGVTYAWLPVVLACGAGLLSSHTNDPLTLYGLLFHDQATAVQIGFAALTCATGLAIGIWDPVSRGYLRQR